MAGETSETGRSGLDIGVGGYLNEEMHPDLQGRKALDVYRAMKDNDALCGAMLFAIDTLVRQVEWDVEQNDAKEEHAEFLKGCMDDMSHSWGDFVSEILSMLPFGFAFHEIVYKKRQGPQRETSKTPSSRYSDGKIGWRKIPLRAQETLSHWKFDDEGGLEAFIQQAPPEYKEVPIPIQKGLLFRTTSYKNNPEGRSIFRSAYASWFYKKRMQQIEGTGIERDLAGFPVFWLPSEYLAEDASPEQKAVVQSFRTIGDQIRRDKAEFLLMPLAYDDDGNKAFDFTLTSSGGARQHDTGQVIQRYNQEIAMSALADFILLGHEKVGSFALSSDKTDLFAVALGTFLDIIADVLNRFAVPRLFALNGFPLDNLPEIVHKDIEKPDLAAIGAFLTALNGAGAPLFPNDDLQDYLFAAAGFPEISDEVRELQEQRRIEAEAQFEGEDEADGQDGGSGTAGRSGAGQAGGASSDRGGSGSGGREGGTGSSGSGDGGAGPGSAAGR